MKTVAVWQTPSPVNERKFVNRKQANLGFCGRAEHLMATGYGICTEELQRVLPPPRRTLPVYSTTLNSSESIELHGRRSKNKS
jgi:hypothetical protein